MDLDLRGRAVIVTGGTRGLGFAAAETLVDEGAKVLICSRSEEHVTDACNSLGPQAHGVVCDVGDPAAASSLRATATEVFGHIDGLLLNYGGPPTGSAMELSDDIIDETLKSVVTPSLRFLRDIGPHIRRGGSIVIIGSTTMVEPLPGMAASNFSRPAVAQAAKDAATTLGPAGIRVNVLMPGRFQTARINQYAESQAAAEGMGVDEWLRREAATIPLRRLGEPVELARVAAFLLSPAASYVTGTSVTVDGGVTHRI